LILDLDSCSKIELRRGVEATIRRKDMLVKRKISSDFIDFFSSYVASHTRRQDAEFAARQISRCLQLAGMSQPTVQQIQWFLQYFYWRKKMFRWVLARFSPRYLLLINAYNDHAVVAAAKELGIQVVELQHGALNRYSPGYAWSTYALPYKSHMPIPDRLFLYGDYWKQELEELGFWGDALESVGSPYMDQFRGQHNYQVEQVTLVVTTQNVDTDQLIEFLDTFVQLANGTMDFRLIIKLHPQEPDKIPYAQRLERYKNVTILSNTEPPPTFELLALADFHLSISSTCHYEALALGTPTVILPFSGHEIAQHLRTISGGYFVGTPQALLELVQNKRGLSVPFEISDFFFKNGASLNIKRELEGDGTGSAS